MNRFWLKITVAVVLAAAARFIVWPKQSTVGNLVGSEQREKNLQ